MAISTSRSKLVTNTEAGGSWELACALISCDWAQTTSAAAP
jgi:hypothetical protein